MKAEKSDKKEFTVPAGSAIKKEKAMPNAFFESSGEFVLPDYMPKVEKLLRTESRVLPPSRYMSGSEIQFSGNVLHSLIYVGDEGEISASVLPSKYEYTVPYDRDSPLETAAHPMLDTVNCRPIAPRKINIRSKMHAVTRFVTSENVLPISFEEIKGINTLCGDLEYFDTKILRAENLTVSEKIEIDNFDGARLVWCGANAAVTDVRTSETGVHTRGEIYVKILADNGGEVKMHVKKIPFEEYLESELTKKAASVARACVIATEAGKESGGAIVDITLLVEATVCTPCKTEVVLDAFSENAAVNVEYGSIASSRLLGCRSGLYNVSGNVPLSVLAGYEEMLDVTGDATVLEACVEKGRTVVNGKCNLNFIYKTASGAFSSAESTVPFRLYLDLDSSDTADVFALAELFALRTRADAENIVCDMEISLSARVTEQSEMKAVESIDQKGARVYEESKYPICLVYPKGESLWSIAKKYHVSPEKLAIANSLVIERKDYTSESALSKSKILIMQF